MEARSLSEVFRAQLGEGEKVVAAVFTTYNFEPEFFEQEIIPLMLDQGLAFSSDQRIKSIQVREALGEAGLPIEVFYDLDMFRQQGTVSPAMEYLHHGIRGERRALHAKLVLLLVQYESSGEQALCVGAGSANLTGAGWWENLECQHWERVASGAASRRFINQLQADVAWLMAQRQGAAESVASALEVIGEFLARCRTVQGAEPVSYYGLTSLHLGQRRRPAFFKFLLDAFNEHCTYQRWSLDIISPYFAESADFDGHQVLARDLGVDEIRLFLPVNEQGEAFCRQEYFDRIQATDGIRWATWQPPLAKALGLAGGTPRRTHAKIYHLYNGKQSWVFVGSVNFTHRAVADNQEAGFFTRLPSPQGSLLQPLREVPEKWCPEEALPGAGDDRAPDRALPDLRLHYDWKARQLSGAIASAPAASIDLLTPEGPPLATGLAVAAAATPLAVEPDAIEGLLQASGFVRVAGRLATGEEFPAHLVMVQQTHWSHRPLDLPRLTPQEIMQIYAGLSQLRRNQVIEHLKERQLQAMGLGGEATARTEYGDQGRQFFAEYAELFHAFRNLRQRLEKARTDEQWNLLDYYLSGRGMDSLPTLLESLFEDERELDPVTVYLALLCLVQIYDQPGYAARPQVAGFRNQCWQKLMALETGKELKLLDADPARSTRFFTWYREQFFREYRERDGEGSDAAA